MTDEKPVERDIIVPRSRSDPYMVLAERVAASLVSFARALETQSVEYWTTVAKVTGKLGDEDPDWPGGLSANQEVILEAINKAQAQATVAYRLNCHHAAIDFVSGVMFAITGANLGEYLAKQPKGKGEPCPNQSS